MTIDLKTKTGSITLDSGHSLMNSFRPKQINVQDYTDIIMQELSNKGNFNELENFGFWEASTPNYTTYYPDVTADDLLPKDEEFIFPIFRALSATVLWKGYRPIDFSKPGVLKGSMNLLIGQTINADHETALGNAMGSVKSVAWQESYSTTVNGKTIKVPAGINAEFKIDGKANPRIARGILMDPPAIHSNSVSVRFEWEPSHALKDMDEFYRKLGTYDDKNNLYRLIVTKIIQYSETSLVAHGADAYAQIIRDGKIANPEYADSVYKFSAKDEAGKELKTTHCIDYKVDLTMDLSLNADNTTPLNINNNNKEELNQKTMEAFEILEGLFSLEKDSLSLDNLKEKLEEALSTRESNLTEDLNQEKTDLETEVERLKPFEPLAEKFNENLTNQRTEVERLYKLCKEEKDQKPEVLKLIAECDEALLSTLQAEYEETLSEKFPDSCGDCGGTNINKASTLNHDGGGEDTKDEPKSVLELRDDFRTRPTSKIKK